MSTTFPPHIPTRRERAAWALLTAGSLMRMRRSRKDMPAGVLNDNHVTHIIYLCKYDYSIYLYDTTNSIFWGGGVGRGVVHPKPSHEFTTER